MAVSRLDQALQIRSSVVYDDTIASAHTVGVAEGQTSLEGDINVLRTLVKNFLGKTNWYDASDITLDAVQNKFFLNQIQPSGFIDVATGTGTSSTAFDTAVKTITGHNNGGGNSTTGGVIVYATKSHRLIIRNHSTQDAINDGSGNEVYGKLVWTGTQYRIDWYSWQTGSEVAYNFTGSVNVDLMYVLVSEPFKSLTWDSFVDGSFHDTSGFTGSVDDDNVVVSGMAFLLNGLTTQAQVNVKLDKLGSTANGEGASGIAIEDASTWYTGADVEAALNEIEALFGATTSTTYNFTENNVLLDNDTVYPALNKLDLKWGDLASTANGEGASLVGIEDAGGYTTATDVEAALQEIYGELDNQSVVKIEFTTTVVINSGVPWTLPGGLTYTPAANGQNLDVSLSGAHQMSGAANDYVEVAGTPSTQITWNKTIPVGRNIILWARQ